MDVIADVSSVPFVFIKYVPRSWLVIRRSKPNLQSEISAESLILVSYCFILLLAWFHIVACLFLVTNECIIIAEILENIEVRMNQNTFYFSSTNIALSPSLFPSALAENSIIYGLNFPSQDSTRI